MQLIVVLKISWNRRNFCMKFDLTENFKEIEFSISCKAFSRKKCLKSILLNIKLFLFHFQVIINRKSISISSLKNNKYKKFHQQKKNKWLNFHQDKYSGAHHESWTLFQNNDHQSFQCLNEIVNFDYDYLHKCRYFWNHWKIPGRTWNLSLTSGSTAVVIIWTLGKA